MIRRRFFVAFGLVAVLIAGALSYLASASPDGLEAVAERGCETADTGAGDELTGDCIAQDTKDHALSSWPFADYTIDGDDALTGVAGVLGVLATLAVATGLFWLLRRRSPSSTED